MLMLITKILMVRISIISIRMKEMRQFGIRLEQRELIGVLNTIPLNNLRFVVEETICTKCSDEVHQEIVDRPVSGVYKVSFVL